MSPKAKRQRGFTLVEVMVALIIVAVALPAFLTLVMTQLDGTASIRDKTMAYWVAENELTRLRLLKKYGTDYRLPDEQQGTVTQAGLEWRWQLENGPMKLGEFGEMPEFRQIEISVSPAAQEDNVMARLTGVFRETTP
ncbi:type II secretion system minor pseudopilin GspI [Marinimicrobium agarilyticum]|uniref:type II secretion system minor pseudopilin GspI n=1 Tax=Marinimicrobium agarilyticum TaxID=306546 RepID=UPI00041B2900|nr:type II secretion system minor pseudopilin GspI [Marinimicrobium agarilyticum]